MKRILSIVFLFILLTGCSLSSSSSGINEELMDDNAQLVNIVNRTTISDLSEDDITFIDEFLNKHFYDKEKFNKYNEKEQQMIMEAVETIDEMKAK